jgi:hypothetical protein
MNGAHLHLIVAHLGASECCDLTWTANACDAAAMPL